MEIIKTNITIRELCEDYTNDTETNIENGVYAYGGKLCVRPAFQRSFVYDKKQENAVIDTGLKGFPLNIMYWADNGNGTYDCLDGQQRTTALMTAIVGLEIITEDFTKKRIKIAFNPLLPEETEEERFKVQDNAILKDKKWIPDISVVFAHDFDSIDFVMKYCEDNPGHNPRDINASIMRLMKIQSRIN